MISNSVLILIFLSLSSELIAKDNEFEQILLHFQTGPLLKATSSIRFKTIDDVGDTIDDISDKIRDRILPTINCSLLTGKFLIDINNDPIKNIIKIILFN